MILPLRVKTASPPHLSLRSRPLKRLDLNFNLKTPVPGKSGQGFFELKVCIEPFQRFAGLLTASQVFL